MPGNYIDLGNPVSDHPLNRGLVSWWLPLPHLFGGQRLWDLCKRNHGTLTNGPTWTPGPGGFGALACTASAYVSDCGITDSIWGQTDGSLVLLQRKRDTTARASGAYTVSSDMARINVHLPYSDNNIYWDFGGFSSGTNRLAVAYPGSIDTKWHHWVFTVGGGLGMRCYRDGDLVGSNAATPTRGTSGASVTCQIGNGVGVGGDEADYESCQVYNRALSAVEVRALYEQSLTGHPDTLRRWSRISYFGGTVASGAIAGTASLVLTDSAALTGDGALAATPSTVVTSTALLAGDGVLASAAPLTITESAALTGGGELASSASLALTTTALLVGDGFLASTPTLAMTESAVLVGAGVLAVAAPLALTTSAPLAGSGVLAGSASVAIAESVTLLGTGFLASTTSTVFTMSAALTPAGGPILGTAALVVTTTGVLAGSGALASAATLALTTAAAVGTVSVVTAVVEFAVRFPAVQTATAAFEHVRARAQRFPHVQPHPVGFVR